MFSGTPDVAEGPQVLEHILGATEWIYSFFYVPHHSASHPCTLADSGQIKRLT